MQVLVLITVLLTSCCVQANHEEAVDYVFEMVAGDWSVCTQVFAGTSECHRTRDIACVRASDNTTAPWYYCNATERLDTVEVCLACDQNCVVTEWSEWSNCNCNTDLFQNRTRNVVVPQRNGGHACPALVEQAACECAQALVFDQQPRRFTWFTGTWGNCIAFNTTTRCGAGVRTRVLKCVDTGGIPVEPFWCLQALPYAKLHPPSPERYCEVPCPCQFEEEWSDYSPCTPNCDVFPPTVEQTRTKQVILFPTLGLSCDEMEMKETRSCPPIDGACPDYIWKTSSWSPCTFQTGSTCGSGLTTRYVYCSEVKDGVARSVESDKCVRLSNSAQPSSVQSCNVTCPQPCVMGAWSQWTECPQVCTPAYRNRTRSILVPSVECPHTTELNLCPTIPCAQIQYGSYGSCIHPGGCGLGTKSRTPMCVGPDLQPIGFGDCVGLPLDLSAPCHTPCPNDCVATEWSEWSPCSEPCGGVAGMQTRHRHIAAFNSSCPYTNDLTDTRSCRNTTECTMTRYYIQKNPWGPCTGDNGAELSCGATGTRSRTSQCMQNGQVASSCPQQLRNQPTEEEACTKSCTTSACVLSEWSPYSACSSTCGTGTKHRTRYVVQYPSVDSPECDVEEDGLRYQYDVCNLEVCDVDTRHVGWLQSSWSSCHLYNTVNPQDAGGGLQPDTCGLGYMNRTVPCVVNGTEHVVSDLLCLETRPDVIRSCHVPCDRQCLVTEWSKFTTCSFGGRTTSKREIIPHIGCQNYTHCCPRLSPIQLEQSRPCPTFAAHCHQFFVVSNYADNDFCINDDPSAACGNGMENRGVACVDVCTSLTTPLDASFCGDITTPTSRPCTVRCRKQNCIQSEWSRWGSCSATCGGGVRVRTRVTETPNEDGGRPCGSLREIDTCSSDPCPYAEVKAGPFGGCVPTNAVSMCGTGTRTRERLCYVDTQLRDFSACQALGASYSFSLSEACVSPCPGVCVAGEWGEWERLSGGCQRERVREILRDTACNGVSLQEFDDNGCSSTSETYRWLVTVDWGDCIVAPLAEAMGDEEAVQPGHYCGPGVKSRVYSCVDSDDAPVAEELCAGAGVKPVEKKSCSVTCPVDCVVGTFSEWSECAPCSYDTSQRRQRPVISPRVGNGTACPELVQTRPCISTGCTSFVEETHASLVTTDYTENSQCGYSLVRQPISCRNNVMFMSPSECRDNRDEPVDITTPLSCPLETNCTYGPWSDWSPCLSICTTPGVLFTFRARQLLTSVHSSMAGCEAEQVEQMQCFFEGGSGEAECVEFVWQVTPWTPNGRNVSCQSTSTRIRVDDSACSSSTKPRSRNETCVGICPTHAICDDQDGVCAITCDSLSEEVEGVCLPNTGCFSDTHCLLYNMECDETIETCVCVEGSEYEEVTGRCSGLPHSTNMNNITTTSIITEDQGGGGLGVIPLALIGAVPLLIFIPVVVILIFVMYKCRKRMEQKHTVTEMKRRRTKASISSPSPLPQTEDEVLDRMREFGGLYTRSEPMTSTFMDNHHDSHHDEPFPQSSPQRHRQAPVHPIPIAAPLPPQPLPPQRIHSLNREGEGLHALDQIPRYYLADFPDGGVTTDMTYTTDEDTIEGTTSMGPSSAGSPSIGRRNLPPHLYPTAIHEPSYHGNNCHTHGHHDPHHDHAHSSRAISDNPYVAMQRITPTYTTVRHHRSSSPQAGHAHQGGLPKHMTIPGKDGRIAVGLDNSMLRAVNQLDERSNTPTSVRSSQSHSRRRRRRQHTRAPRYPEGRYHHDNYHRDSYYYRSDGQYSSDHDHYSTSDAEYDLQSPTRHTPGGSYDTRTMPHPRVHFSRPNHRDYPHRSRDYYSPTHQEYPRSDSPTHQRYPHPPLSPSHQGYPHSPTHQEYPRPPQWYQPEPEPYDRRDSYQQHSPRRSTSSQRSHERHASPSGSQSSHRRHASPSGSQRSHRRHASPSGSQSSHRRHASTSSSHRHTPPPSPRDPPNFVPPVPPHAHSPLGGEFDDYDYPERYLPHRPTQLQKLKEESEHTSPYARPRPLTSPGGQGSRVTSPYDYPRIRNAGSVGSPSLASSTPRYGGSTPQCGSSTPQHGGSTPQHGGSTPLITRAVAQINHPPLQESPLNRHSHPSTLQGGQEYLQERHCDETTPQPNEVPPQPSTSTPQPSTLTPQPTPLSSTSTPQPSTSTPQSAEVPPQPHISTPTSNPRPPLTIQITPLSEEGSSSPCGSPFLSRRHYPQSPLVLHSSSVSDESPRTSGDLDTSEHNVHPSRELTVQ